MPIDSRIALGVDPVKVPTVMDLRAQAAQVRNLEAQEPLQQQQAQLNRQRLRGGEMELVAEEQKIAAAKRKEQGFGVLSKLAAQYGDDHKAIAEGLNQAGYADLGLDYLSDTAKIRKEVIDADLKQVQTSKERNELVANVAASVNSQESLQRAVGQLLMAGIPAEVVGPWLAKPWNEQTKAELQQIALSATSAKDQAELLIKQAAEARAAEDAANTRPGKDGLTPYQRASLAQGAETADTRNYKAAVAAGFKGDFNEFLNVDANRKRPVTNVTAGGGGGLSDGDSAIVQTVLANPAFFENLTPTVKTRIGPALARAGFDQFGRSMSAGEVSKLTDLEEAIQSVDGLIGKVNPVSGSHRNLFGPVVGRTGAIDPYNESAQAMQAELNLIKQRIGKALEGGVLRKEDEEKYRKILPVLSDTPEVAAQKVRQLKGLLARDLEIAKKANAGASRRPVGEPSPPAGGGAPKVGGMFNGQKILKVERVE